MGNWGIPQVAVAALGVALIVFFAGTTAAIAAGANTPTALWAAGGAISGGLLGLLLPQPAPSSVRKAASDARRRALGDPAVAAPAPGALPPDPKAVDAAAGTTSWTTVWILVAVFVALLILAVVLAGGAIVPPSNFGAGSIWNLTKTVIALASAAGTGVIGLLAPAPSR